MKVTISALMDKVNIVVAQEVEVVYHQEGRRFDPRLLQSACQSVLWQDNET